MRELEVNEMRRVIGGKGLNDIDSPVTDIWLPGKNGPPIDIDEPMPHYKIRGANGPSK